MPRDDFAKARNKQIANRVRYEIAIGFDRINSVAESDFSSKQLTTTSTNALAVSPQKKKKLAQKIHSSKRQIMHRGVGTVDCPRCGDPVKPSNLAKHLDKVHSSVPGVIPKPFVNKKRNVSISADPPRPQESMPKDVRCAICREHVYYSGLLAHYAKSHARELPAFTDETCHS